MNLRQIAVILFIFFFFSTPFISPADAKKSIRFELTAKLIKTEYANGIPEDNPTIDRFTRILGDFGYEGSFETNNGMYQVQAAWLDTTFNIQNNLLANATLHLTTPKLTDAEYHFVQEDLDVGSFYYLDRWLELLNNIEMRLVSDVGDTPLEFELTGEDVCKNVNFTEYKRGNETHYETTEIHSCDSDSILTIILEVEDSFWWGSPKVETSPDKYLVFYDFNMERRKQLEIRNIGSGDLLINDIDIRGDDADFFSVENISNCTSDSIAPDRSCTVEVVLKREDFTSFIVVSSLHIFYNSYRTYEVRLMAYKRRYSVGAIIGGLLLSE